MTDIYLRSSGGRKKGLWIALAVLAALGVGLAWRSCGSKEAPPPEGVATPTPAPREAGASPSLSMESLREKIAAGRLADAREAAFARLARTDDALTRREIERLLGELHTRMVFSAYPMAEKTVHEVKAGDTLGKLAQRYGTTVDSITAINDMDSNLIRVGDRLRILTGDFRCEVDKTRNEMEVYLNDRFFKRYLVGTGTDSSTPTGEYVITLRIRHPIWYRPDGQTIPFGDPENLLGTHYLKLDVPGIGLHGTWEPASVGSQSSAGCVRLVNDDIQELYHLLPEGTNVVITDG